MQPNFTPRELAALHRRLAQSYRPKIELHLYDLDGRVITQLPNPSDGVVTGDHSRDVTRIWTGTLFDPTGAARLDTLDPSDGNAHLDRIIRITWRVDVPELGDDVSLALIPMYGWLTKAIRGEDGLLSLEAQGLERRAMFGVRPFTVPAGTLLVDAIETIMRRCCGERRFRFPAGRTRRLKQDVNIGWRKPPWPEAQRLAAADNLELFYSCDGVCTLQEAPTVPVVNFIQPDGPGDFGNITSAPQRDGGDALETRNVGIVTGKGKAAGSYVASGHANAPTQLARHGVPFYMPEIESDDKYTSDRAAEARATQLVRERIGQQGTQVYDVVPHPHLDVMDLVTLRTPDYFMRHRARAFNLPTTGADMTINQVLRIPKPRKGVIRR